jgi:mRNA-degrading endonuclease RelE of RelBE toxin-antitoxin system
MIVIPSNQFEKSVSKLKDKIAKSRLLVAIDKFKKASSLKEISNIKIIVGQEDLYRMRVGDYRLLFSHKQNTIEVLLLEYIKRDENTYKKK